MTAAKQRIVTAFDRAEDYDAHAGAQRRAAEALARRIAALQLAASPRVLEFGCGTGFLAEAAAGAFVGADWLMTDIASDMVARSRRRFAGRPGFRFALLDAEDPRLAPGEGRFDLVCSNLAVQWFDDPVRAADRLFRLVRPGGYLIFSTLADGTFAEWENAHRALGLRSGLRPLPSICDLQAMRPLGVEGEVSCELIVEAHADARCFLGSLRAIGAATPRAGHRPLPPAAMRAVMRRFEAAGARASYAVATCCFRRPALEPAV